jgi:hypothetical protein
MIGATKNYIFYCGIKVVEDKDQSSDPFNKICKEEYWIKIMNIDSFNRVSYYGDKKVKFSTSEYLKLFITSNNEVLLIINSKTIYRENGINSKNIFLNPYGGVLKSGFIDIDGDYYIFGQFDLFSYFNLRLN